MKSEYIEIDFYFEQRDPWDGKTASFRTLVPIDAIHNVRKDNLEDGERTFLLVDGSFLYDIGLVFPMPSYYFSRRSELKTNVNPYPKWVPIANKYEIVAGKLMNSKATEILFDKSQDETGE